MFREKIDRALVNCKDDEASSLKIVSPAPTSAPAKFVNNNYRILFIFGVIHFYYFTNWSLWVTKLFLFAEEKEKNT